MCARSKTLTFFVYVLRVILPGANSNGNLGLIDEIGEKSRIFVPVFIDAKFSIKETQSQDENDGQAQRRA